MKNNHSNHSYGYKDFQAYHSGNMSQADMHALEKAALEDPFLSQALEGFKNQPSLDEDILLLRKRIEKRTIQKSTASNNHHLKLLFTSLSVAASILIIIVGAYFVLIKHDEATINRPLVADNQLAPKVEPSPPTNIATTPEMSETTNKTISNTSHQNAPSLKMTLPELTQLKGNDKIEIDFSGKKEAVSEPPSVVEDLAIQTPVVSGNTKELKKYYESSTITTNENIDTPANNPIKISTSKDDEIAMSPVAASSTRLSLQASTEKAMVASFKSQPQSGWPTFNQYLSNNKKKIYDSNGNIIKGIVMLSFSINKKGNPTHIKVEHSLHKECDKEAIRLLQHGGLWQKANNQRVSLEVEF